MYELISQVKLTRLTPELFELTNYKLPPHIFEDIKKQVASATSIQRKDYEYIKNRIERQTAKEQYAVYLRKKKCRLEDLNDAEVLELKTIIKEKQEKALSRITEFRHFFKPYNGTFGIGIMYIVEEILKKNKVRYEVVDKNIKDCKAIAKNIKRDDYDRFYQYKGLKQFFKNGGYGIVAAPTGSGKTFIGINASKILRHPTLYIVKNVQAIQKDVKEDLDLFAKEEKTQLIINGYEDFLNYKEDNLITVITIHTLLSIIRTLKNTKVDLEVRKKIKERWVKLISTIRFLIVDESHTYGTPKRVNVLKNFVNAYQRLFLSGTPFKGFLDVDKESENTDQIAKLNILEFQNKIVYIIPEQTLVKQKYLARMAAVFINVYSPEVSERKFGSGIEFQKWWNNYITNDEWRNKTIKEVKEIILIEDLKTVYLTRLIEQAEKLSKDLSMPFIFSKTKPPERKKVIEDLVVNNKSFIASGIFNDGVNIPEMQVFVNCAGGKDENLIIQRKGRVGRQDTKTMTNKLYVDFVDWGNTYVEDHSLSRVTALEKSIGESNIINIDMKDFKEFIKDYFKS